MTQTNAQRLAAKDLEKYVAFYATGCVPTEHEMERAPRLESWFALLRVDANEERFMTIQGIVYGSAKHGDGGPLQTSPVVWFDRHRRFVRTRNTLYALGQPAGNEVTGDAE